MDSSQKRQSDKLKVKVDWDLCIGCTVCTSEAKKTFRMTKNTDGEDKAEVMNEFGDDLPAIKNAVDRCPTSAISTAKDDDSDDNDDGQ